MLKKAFSFSVVVLIAACSIGEVRRNVFSHPNWQPETNNQDIQRLIIASTHGFEDRLEPLNESIPLKGQLSEYQVQIGGVKILSSYLDILKKRYKNDLLLLDTGPSLSHNQTQSDILSTLDFYNKVNYHGIAFTEREVGSLLAHNKIIEEKKLPFINSNILEIQTNQAVQRNHIVPNRVININGVKIGLVSASLPDKKQDSIKGLYFEDPVLSFLKNKNSLKRQGAEVILLLANLKSACRTKKPAQGSSPDKSTLDCPDSEDNLISLLKRLPKGSIDAIIGHGKNFAHGFHHGIPIVQVPSGKPYLSRIELFYHKKKKQIIAERSYIHAPTKLCYHFFMATNDCHIEGNTARLKSIEKSNFQLIPAKFLGLEVFQKTQL